MQITYDVCCGIDVHKKMIMACLRKGNKKEIREYSTLTKDLRDMANWLESADCKMVAMESTGSYWKPIYNILEMLGLNAIVVNAQHMKTVPGRKTDVKDAEWIADLLRHGLLKASFIPNKEQREIREVSRYRKSLIEERAREKNRLQKVLEGANIKLASVLQDISGLSSRSLINGMLEDNITPETIDNMLFGSAKEKKQDLLQAMDGICTKVQKTLIKAIIDHIDDMTERIKDLDSIINKEMKKYDDAINAIDEIPGIGRQSAETIIAEIGVDMDRFPSPAHLASWAGLCPGNNESAGKKKTGRSNKGNKILKTTMTQSAQSAIRNKNSFFKAQYDRLVVRRGANKAKVAVAHSIIIAIWHILKHSVPYKDLGSDYYNKQNAEKKKLFHLKKLLELGWIPPVQVAP